jgi:CBS domain-containing protein
MMQLREVMTTRVELARPEDTLDEAAEKMKRLNVGSLPVCDGERLVGVLTDRDITVRSTAAGYDPKSIRVREVMTPDVVYCFEDQDVQEAAQIMQEKRIRRLVILNHQKRLVGIVSLGDLAVQTTEQDLADEELSDTLTGISNPAEPRR